MHNWPKQIFKMELQLVEKVNWLKGYALSKFSKNKSAARFDSKISSEVQTILQTTVTGWRGANWQKKQSHANNICMILKSEILCDEKVMNCSICDWRQTQESLLECTRAAAFNIALSLLFGQCLFFFSKNSSFSAISGSTRWKFTIDSLIWLAESSNCFHFKLHR